MNILQKLADLTEKLGDERLEVLTDRKNVGCVLDLCNDLLRKELPSELTITYRVYEIVELHITKDEPMLDLSKQACTNLGKNDGQHLLDNQDRIPASFRDLVIFIFTNWPDANFPNFVYSVWWSEKEGRWVRCQTSLNDGNVKGYRFLRRKK